VTYSAMPVRIVWPRSCGGRSDTAMSLLSSDMRRADPTGWSTAPLRADASAPYRDVRRR
jgi:hypothetical protein